MSSSDWLPKFPSVNEILDKPPLRAVVERLNRSAVSTRVRSFLEDIRDEIQARTGEISLSELAERAARYVLGSSSCGHGRAINATGQLWGESWIELPLAEAALERMLLVSRDFMTEWSSPNEMERLACELTDSESALFLHSRLAGLELVLRACAEGGAVVISRSDLGEFASGCRLTDLIALAGCSLLEVGSINSTTVDDYTKAVTLHPAMLLSIESPEFVLLGQSRRVTILEFAEVATKGQLPLLVDLGRNPLVEDLPTDGRDTISAKQALAEGADLVLVSTDGFIGGPSGALLLGAADLVERVKRHPLAPSRRANGMTTAALAATLELSRDRERAPFTVPILSLLDTPLENLRTRAERMSPQMACPRFAKVEAVQTEKSPHLSTGRCQLPSWEIRLFPEDGDPVRTGDILAKAEPPILGRLEAAYYALDLRTVFPRQDIALIRAIKPTED